MVAQINRLIFLRELHTSKGQDTTEHEIVLEHVRELCATRGVGVTQTWCSRP